MPSNCPKRQVMTLVIRMLLSSVLLLSTLPALSQGQITLDGSLGPRGPLTGPNYRIDANVGQIRGSNLFHSFGQFNVRTGERATFTRPNTIANIVGRVTGGEQSLIDGRLRSEIAGANLFLLNPSGVMFGPHASLEVSGSFHISTADFLRFADGAKFFANLGQESVLTVASPAAFGFLSNNPAAITIQRSALQVSEGKAVSVVGGDITLVGGTLRAPSGRIQLASVASPGEVVFSPLELAPDLQVDSFARLGRLELSQGALLNASGVGDPGSGGPGGTVLIRSGRLTVDRSRILANTMGDVSGTSLGLDLRIAADAVITNDSVLRSSPFAAGNGGNVVMNVGRLTLTDGSRISSSSFGAGRGGDLTVTASDAIAIAGRDQDGKPGGLFSNAFSLGDAGRLSISAATLTMDDGLIRAGTGFGSRGNAGGAEVRVGQLTLTGGAEIDTSTRGSGRGGDLQVAADAISIAGLNKGGLPSGLFSEATGLGSGYAGNINVQVGRLTLSDGAQISTSTFGSGRGGDLIVAATDFVSIAGHSSQDFPSGLFSEANASGDAGNIEVRVGQLTLTGGAQISSSTSGPGRGGKLTVAATESISIAGHDGDRSALLSNAFGQGSNAGAAGDLGISTPVLIMNGGRIVARTEGDGNAGNIEVRVGRLELTGGAQIFNGTGTLEIVNGERVFKGTGGPGQGGKLTVIATDAIFIVGHDSEGFQSALSSNAQKGTGKAGDLFISTPSLTIQGGKILASTESASSGDAGNLTLEVGKLVLTDGALISSSTSGTGQGGTVTVKATDAFIVVGPASGIFSSASNKGNAGQVMIFTPTLQITEGAVIDSSTIGNGQGGNIAVQAQQIDLGKGGTISTRSSGKGNAGNIVIQAGQIFRSRNGAVTTEAETADGGNIMLTAGSLVDLRESQMTATVKSGMGRGGNITIDSQSVVLEGSQIRADAFGGPGGNVRIVSDVFLADPASRVSASSTLGIQGTVDIRAPVTSLSGALAPLPQAFVSAAALLPARCVARAPGGAYSSLVLGGRDGLPYDPSGVLPSPLVLDDRLAADPSVTGASRPPQPSRGALLHGADKVFPRLPGRTPRGGSPEALARGCAQ